MLAEIAYELDQQERALMMAEGTETAEAIAYAAEESGNVDDSGNFSIEVLKQAVKRSHDLAITPAYIDPAVMADVCAQDAFIFNFGNHWFAVRKLCGVWFNLDSVKKRPEMISDTYLSLFIAQLQSAGYSVFVVTGPLPMPMRDGSLGDRASWHSMTELLSAPKPSPAPRLPDFSRIDLLGGIATVARTVGSAVTCAVASLAPSAPPAYIDLSGDTGHYGGPTGHGGFLEQEDEEEEEDEALQLAMAMSLSAGVPPGSS